MELIEKEAMPRDRPPLHPEFEAEAQRQINEIVARWSTHRDSSDGDHD